MKQSKFSLADLLTVLGTLVFGFFCFLSMNFITMGDVTINIVLAVGISLFLGGLAFGVKLIKRTSRNFKTWIIWEWVFLFLFVVAGIFALYPFSPFFNVTSQRYQIQQKLTSNINQVESIYTAYETYANNRLNIYKSHLNSVVSAKRVNYTEYKNYGFVDGTGDNTQVENKMFSLKAQLYPSNYSEMKVNNLKWLSDAKSKITTWSPIGVVKVVNALEVEISSWNEQLKIYSSFRAKGESANDFHFPMAFDDVSGVFKESSKFNPIASIVGVGLYLLMLLSYFITKRHTRYPGLKVIFGIGKSKENEL